MKDVCLFFQVHNPLRLRTYRFFDMGIEHNYLDDAAIRSAAQKLAYNCYIPMNEMLLQLIKANKKRFKVSFYISGLSVEQFKSYSPQVMESFRELGRTGCVEFVAGTYSNSLSSLARHEDFKEEVRLHAEMIKREFDQTPQSFCNTAMIYSDTIGEAIADMGFRQTITEGAKHLLGWKNPNFVYANSLNPRLRLLMRNYRLSDDIGFRFSDHDWAEWPLTADRFASWIDNEDGDVVNISMDYNALGDWQCADTGIFEFMEHLPKAILSSGKLKFSTLAEAAEHQPIGVLHANNAVSWADEERDLSAWLGNELQKEAFNTLYRQADKVARLANPDYSFVWRFMQSADHFYYMGTKWFSDGNGQSRFNPYGSSYEAFINYMNILSDFIIELDKQTLPENKEWISYVNL